MGLTILAVRKMNIEDPRDEFTGPNQSDFAYRNNPEQFELDKKEYDKLVERYEAGTVDIFDIGYISFDRLRRELAQLIGFGHFTGTPFFGDYTFHSKDIEDSKMLNAFFLHSDSDGELAAGQIAVLNKHIQQHVEAVSKSESRHVREFADFVQKSVEEQADWRFL